MTAWTCDLHHTVNFGDCPTCDDDMTAQPMTECHKCHAPLAEGDMAWADDVHVIKPGGVVFVTRYTCDDCEVAS